HEVWNKQWPGQWLSAGQARNFYTGWPVPRTVAAGNYTLTVKALNGAGQQVFAQGGLAPFTVVPAAPAATPPPAAPIPSTLISAPAGPSGQAMPVGDIPGWHQVFADDFTADVPLGSFPSAVAGKWSAYPDGWKDTSRNGTYMPSQVLSEHNGLLDMYIHTANGVHMVSAPEPKIPGATGAEGGLRYGRYAVRFRADAIPGYKTAWLLWPDSENWPGAGEIDFPEGNLSGTMCAYMHHLYASSGGDQDAYCTGASYTGWHTAVTEWTPGSVRFFLDGRLLGTSTSRIPSSPMHWVLQTETNTSGTAPGASAAGHVLVDWVSVYTSA
ncbi:MAG: glycoside hydrolase family 16 protein, partial [Chloroflexota bacterium]